MPLNGKKEDDFYAPLLIAKESDTESLIIRERDSCNLYAESTLSSDAQFMIMKNKITIEIISIFIMVQMKIQVEIKLIL